MSSSIVTVRGARSPSRYSRPLTERVVLGCSVAWRRTGTFSPESRFTERLTIGFCALGALGLAVPVSTVCVVVAGPVYGTIAAISCVAGSTITTC